MRRMFDTSRDMRERIFYVLGFTAVIGNTVGFLSNMILDGMSTPTIVCGICDLIMIILTLTGYATEKTAIPTLLILAILNFFEFPFLVYVYGSGMLPYMILGCVGTAFFFRRGTKQAAAILVIVIDVIWIFYSLTHDSIFGEIDSLTSIGSTICTYIIASIGIFVIIFLCMKQSDIQEQELVRLNEELKISAETDPLTRVYNRRYLTDYLEYLLHDKRENFTAALLDIDHFKNVNDQYGHVFGDEVLVEFCSIIRRNISLDDIVARFGGEEFIIIYRTTDKGKVSISLEHIAEEFAAYSMREKGVRFSFSGGCDEFKQVDEITRLYHDVDEKLYQAKNLGRDRIQW